MMEFSKRQFFVLICCICFQQVVFAQIGNYTKVNKIYKDTYNFLENSGARGKQYRDKGLYVVYSDRDNNSSYLDNLGLQQGEKQPFLTPYFVINESGDFLELVKFDPALIGKPKGVFSFFYGDKYNFSDTKKVEYVGWILKSKLLHFSQPKTSEVNLKPLTYYLGFNDLETLFNINKFIKNDTVITYQDPGLKIKSKKSFHINQFVYLYKYNQEKTAALISNLDHMQPADSLKRIMGWVPAQLVKNIGQRKVWNANDKKDIVIFNPDSGIDTIKTRNIRQAFLFQPEKKMNTKESVKADSPVVSHIPINIWDHYNNKLINVKGGDVLLREIPEIRRDFNTFNFHYIFDCSESLREELILQIASLQRIWLLISEDPRFTDKNFTFSASSFGCNYYYEFPKSDSFVQWMDYLQNVFLNDTSIKPKRLQRNSLENCLVNVIDNQNLIKNFENNIVLVVGETNLNFNMPNNRQLLYDLSKVSARLLFFQLENRSDKRYQDFILEAKLIIDDVGHQYRDYISNYIVENKELLDKNLFVSIDANDNNIYLHDAPQNSMYTGGIVFPKINKKLSPKSFDLALDSLLNKTIAKNNQILNSLEIGAGKLGFLRSELTNRVRTIIKKDAISRSDFFLPKINKHEGYLETSALSLKHNKPLKTGYLFTKNELEAIIESYKSFIPIVNEKISRKQRKQLRRKYGKYYRELNKFLFYKELKKRSTIAELLTVKTGVPVSDKILNTVKIKDVHRKSKLSHGQYKQLMQVLRSKISYLESLLNSPSTTTYIDGGKKRYYYISEKHIL